MILGGEKRWKSNSGSVAVIRIDDVSGLSCWRIFGGKGMSGSLSLAGVGDVNDDRQADLRLSLQVNPLHCQRDSRLRSLVHDPRPNPPPNHLFNQQ